LNVNSTPLQESKSTIKYEIPAPFSYTTIIQNQRQEMVEKLKDPTIAGASAGVAPY
jgi:hypothetical protein